MKLPSNLNHNGEIVREIGSWTRLVAVVTIDVNCNCWLIDADVFVHILEQKCYYIGVIMADVSWEMCNDTKWHAVVIEAIYHYITIIWRKFYVGITWWIFWAGRVEVCINNRTCIGEYQVSVAINSGTSSQLDTTLCRRLSTWNNCKVEGFMFNDWKKRT